MRNAPLKAFASPMKGKLKAQYWACRTLWAGKGGSTKSNPKGVQGKY